MDYKARLGIGGGDAPIVSTEVDKHFLDLEFYQDTMNPRFMNGYGYDMIRTIGNKCLRHDSSDREGKITRVFFNRLDLYIEVQTPYRSYDTSWYRQFDSTPTVAEVEEFLNDILC